MLKLLELPTELLLNIIERLSPFETAVLAHTCRQLWHLTQARPRRLLLSQISSLSLTQWASQRVSVQKLIISAIQRNDVAAVVWLRKNIYRFDYCAIVLAANLGNRKILKIIFSCNSHEDIGWVCARNNYRTALEVMHEQGLTFTKWVCYHAAKSGNLKLLQWLREKGTPVDVKTCLENCTHDDVREWLISSTR